MPDDGDPFRPVPLRIGETGYAGRGVFAGRAIAAGELIEECPVIVVSQTELQSLFTTVLSNYFFQWGPDREEGALALGYGMLYNHSFSPNATYVRKYEAKTIFFVAVHDIAAGDEITVNYNGWPEDRTPVWF